MPTISSNVNDDIAHHQDDDPSETRLCVNENGNELQQDKLALWEGVALLTADCIGVGVLALPNAVKVLGSTLGFGFLIANLPINYYAGDMLSTIGLHLEGRGREHQYHKHSSNLSDDNADLDDLGLDDTKQEYEMTTTTITTPPLPPPIHEDQNTVSNVIHKRTYGSTYADDPTPSSTLSADKSTSPDQFQDEESTCDEVGLNTFNAPQGSSSSDAIYPTNDMVAMAKAVFDGPHLTSLVIVVYYMNLFLVLGDYILVMAQAVAAIFSDDICIPMAAALATLFMFGICQFRTMAHLGRSVSLLSLLAMLLVLLQCLFHHRTLQSQHEVMSQQQEQLETPGIWSKFSAMASIGFAVGSQKLFLNIRHELRNKEQASTVLAGSLSTYGTAYVLVIIMAGPNPPSFLFNAIPQGWSRQVAGFLLWGHVAVSYAINSQALCSSMDRYLVATEKHATSWLVRSEPPTRWFVLTFAVALSSYLVSNAVPFFKDLVALIGALTSVPLALTIPALLYRKFQHVHLLWPSRPSCGSFTLLLYSILFLIVGLIGAISSIDQDWLHHKRPFSCQ